MSLNDSSGERLLYTPLLTRLIIGITKSPKKVNSPVPYTLEWLAKICSTRVVPERGIPTIKIGNALFIILPYLLSDLFVVRMLI